MPPGTCYCLCAGPGDSLVLLALCKTYDFTTFVFPPPHKYGRFRAGNKIRPVAFNKPMRMTKARIAAWLVLDADHFTPLLPNQVEWSKMQQIFSASQPTIVLLDDLFDVATATHVPTHPALCGPVGTFNTVRMSSTAQFGFVTLFVRMLHVFYRHWQ